MLNLLMSATTGWCSGRRPTRLPSALMISVEGEVALDPAQQRDQGCGLLVSQISPEHGVKSLRNHPKPVEERFDVRREVHKLVAPVPCLSLPGHEAPLLHPGKVVGQRGPPDANLVGEPGLAGVCALLDAHQDQPHRPRPTRSGEYRFEGSSRPASHRGEPDAKGRAESLGTHGKSLAVCFVI